MFEPSKINDGLILGLFLILAYPFTIYPFLLYLITVIRPKPWQKARIRPTVSLIIAAHNEDLGIRTKLNNVLSASYPRELLDITVVSDGSSDRTDEIVREFAPQVRLIQTQKRVGKQVALNLAVSATRGEILVLTDVGALTPPHFLELLVENFADASIGAVSGVVSPTKTTAAASANFDGDNGEGTYQGLDSWIRNQEGLADSVTGCCGPIYAVRRSCHIPFAPSVANDFASALDIVRQGFRVVLEPKCIGKTVAAAKYQREFKRKVRTIVGGMDTFWQSGVLRWGFQKPLFFWMLLSHKGIRWLSPLVLVALLACVGAEAIANNSLTKPLGTVVAGGLSIFLLGLLIYSRFSTKLLNAFLFTIVSLSAGIWAWVEFALGKKYTVWTPTDWTSLYRSETSQDETSQVRQVGANRRK